MDNITIIKTDSPTIEMKRNALISEHKDGVYTLHFSQDTVKALKADGKWLKD